MKARIKFRKYGALKFIGHLDVMRFFQKVMRRAEIPIAFTGGYSPHMIMSFASPLGIGLTSDGEYFDIELTESIESMEAVRRMNEQMVEGMEVLSFRQIPEEKKMTGMALVAAADYRISVEEGFLPDKWQAALPRFLSQPEIMVLKQTKRSEAWTDIRPMIYQMEEAGENQIFLRLAAGSSQNLKPELAAEAFAAFLGIEGTPLSMTCHRIELYAESIQDGERSFVSLEDLGQEIKGVREI